MKVGSDGKNGDLISLGLARGSDGSFSWVDESPYDVEFWFTGEPNTIDGDEEDCVEA